MNRPQGLKFRFSYIGYCNVFIWGPKSAVLERAIHISQEQRQNQSAMEIVCISGTYGSEICRYHVWQ
jgi:hypothetical protein